MSPSRIRAHASAARMYRAGTLMRHRSRNSRSALQAGGHASRGAGEPRLPRESVEARALRDGGEDKRARLTKMMGEETFHPDTRALLSYGRALAGAGAAPKKGAADHVLERLFVIERRADGRLPIRTFGAELVKLFGADLRDHDFAHFFLAPDLAMMH